MPRPEPAVRRIPEDSVEAEALARDCARSCLRVAGHLDTLWQLGYEPGTGGERTGGRSSDVRGVGSVGDGRVRDALRVIARAQLVVLAEIDKVFNHLNAGPGADTNLRGSLISKSDYERTVARQRQRIATGDSPRPLVPQPLRPKRGNR